VLNFPDRQPHSLDQRPRRAGHHQIDRRNAADTLEIVRPRTGVPDMPDPRPQRSLVRWSLIALAVVVVAMIIYLLTGGSGAQLPPMR
jgi:hypothetical protein